MIGKVLVSVESLPNKRSASRFFVGRPEMGLRGPGTLGRTRHRITHSWSFQ